MSVVSTTHQSPRKWHQHFLFDLPPKRPNCIWLHACSVGEVASIMPLMQFLHDQGFTLHLTVITRTGMAHAGRLMGDLCSISYLPWDLPTLMPRFIKQLQPALMILTETEFWPGMFKACHKKNIPIIGINTRISDRSFPKYHATRKLWQRWLAPVNLFLPQSELDAQRLIDMGVQADKIQVAGNLKYAIQSPQVDTQALRERLDPSCSRPILLMASSHADEEERLLKMWPAWHAIHADILTVIVPRHPERFEQVAEQINAQGLKLSRWSDKQIQAQSDVILIDAMGVLTQLYSIADIAIIAGSLVPIGGHNPIEAAVYGRGVITGPHIQNFRDIMQQMSQAGAAVIAQSDAELEQAVSRFLQKPDELRQLHAHAALFMQEKAQVLDSITEAIQPYLEDIPKSCA